MSLPSKRGQQRDRAAEQAHSGFIGDPLKLPFAKILQEVRRIRLSDAFYRLVVCGACALTIGEQEELYLQTVKGLDKHDLDVIVRAFGQLIVDMEDRPFTDLLGPVYMEIESHTNKGRTGEFFTPHAISALMGKMLLADKDVRASFPADRPLEGSEPACGTGSMVLAFTQSVVEAGINPIHTRWTLQDISDQSCYAAFINVTLWGIPAQVLCGNTLAMEVRWGWRNRFWPLARPLPAAEPAPDPDDVERAERTVRAVQQFLEITQAVATPAEPPPPTPAPPPPTPKAPRSKPVQPSLFD